jgi:hypothetical protein
MWFLVNTMKDLADVVRQMNAPSNRFSDLNHNNSHAAFIGGVEMGEREHRCPMELP